MPSLTSLAALMGALLGVALVVMSAVHQVAPQRDGLLALSQILAPYLFLLLVPFLVLLRTRGRAGRLLRWATLAAIVVFAIRFVPGWLPLSGPPAGAATAATDPTAVGATRPEVIRVATWNLELGQPDGSDIVERLVALDADVVGLVELTPAHAEAIAADPRLIARYPTRELRPTPGSLGIGLLSTLPALGEPRKLSDPPILVQRLEAPDGRTLTAVTAHPLPGRIETWGKLLPVGYDSSSRDRHLAQVRAVIDPILASGEPLLLIGDFNVVDREPGFAELVRGLTDAHRAVGFGPGDTWRPGRLEWLPFGLLRIDLLLSANGVTPVSIAPDCTPSGSDHCLLSGEMSLPPPPAPGS